MPAPAAGTITELLAAEGDTVTVGQVIGRIARRGPAAGGAPPAPPAPARAPRRRAAGAAAAPARAAKASPVARRAAAALGVDLGSVAGSGPAGRIVKADVLDGRRARRRGRATRRP